MKREINIIVVLLALLTAIFVFVLSSCSPQSRIQRIIDRHPELTIRDTIIDLDTFVTRETHVDSVFSMVQLTDTVAIEKENLKIKLLWKHDSIYVFGKVMADTIYVTEQIPVEKIKYVKEGLITRRHINWFIIIALVMLVIYLLRYLLPRPPL